MNYLVINTFILIHEKYNVKTGNVTDEMIRIAILNVQLFSKNIC
jgi:hypothetical protein